MNAPYLRLGITHSLEATVRSSARAARISACAEAQHWFALGEPIVAAGSAQSEQWRYLARGLPEMLAKQANACPNALTVSR